MNWNRCFGTNAKYALRCKRTARAGEHTCAAHKDQDVSRWVALEAEELKLRAGGAS